jgi:hypothetical protein
MRNIRWIWLIIFASLLVGFTRKPPLPTEGIYPVKLRAFTIFDIEGIPGAQAELTETKPDYLKIDPELEQIKEIRFGSFIIGNNEQKVWFLMARDKQGFWAELYIDQNADNRIATNEKVRGILVGSGKDGKNEFYAATTNIAFPIRVSFKGAGAEIQKKQYFFVQIKTYYKKVESESVVTLFSSSFFNGEMKALIGKEVKVIKFRIIDANGNGCFNDFGKDQLSIDINFDGYFTAKEAWPLAEYFTVTGPDKQKKQLRMIVPPHPAKIAVVGATDDIDWSQLEPLSDPKDKDE